MVTSSCVGPTPPDVNTTSCSAPKRETSAAMRSTSSGITVMRRTSTPRARSSRHRYEALASTILPDRISLPTRMIPAVFGIGRILRPDGQAAPRPPGAGHTTERRARAPPRPHRGQIGAVPPPASRVVARRHREHRAGTTPPAIHLQPVPPGRGERGPRAQIAHELEAPRVLGEEAVGRAHVTPVRIVDDDGG